MVTALGGFGLFGVELFVCGDEVIFSEVSPRPHDTGMVTLISQDMSEFALHARAFRSARWRGASVWPGRLRRDPSGAQQQQRQLRQR